MQKNYRCPRCRATMEFDPELGKMHCKYCGGVFSVPKSDESADAKKAEEAEARAKEEREEQARKEQEAKREKEKKKQKARQHAKMKMQILHCNSCGAELAVNEVEASSFCAYCGQATVVLDRVEEYLEPDYIIPFSVTKDQAESAIREKLKRGYYVPSVIKNFEVEKLRGIYIPFWLYDIYYGDEKYFKYSARVTSKTYVTRYIHHVAEMHFKRLTQDASKRLNDDISERLEPYDMAGLKEFQPMYLSGFYADRFDVGTKDAKDVALTRAKKLFDEAVKQDLCDHSNLRLTYTNPLSKVIKSEYALLPAWFLTFRIEDQPYTILVNGQTGKTIGAVPCVKKKATLTFLILSIIFSAITVPFAGFLVGPFSMVVDTEGAVLYIMALLGIMTIAAGIAWGKGIRKLWAFHDSIKLTCSGDARSFVHERQEK